MGTASAALRRDGYFGLATGAEGDRSCTTWEVGDSVSPPKATTALPGGKRAGQRVDRYKARKLRAFRFVLRSTAQAVSEDKVLAGCGKRVWSSEIQMRQKGSSQAFYAGIMTCSKLWLCAVCAAKIRMVRSVDIEAAVSQHLVGGGGVEFVTLTVRHQRSQTLDVLYPAVAKAWRSMFQGAPGQRLRADFGMIGRIRANEITYGRVNGWHPHIHVLIFTVAPLGPDARAALHARLHAGWSRRIFAATGLAPSLLRGVTVKPVTSVTGADFSRYMTKVQDASGKDRSIGMEMARADLKRDTRKDNCTPFEMLERLAEHDRSTCPDCCSPSHRCVVVGWCSWVPGYRQAWLQFEQATKGRRAIEWSKGLRAMFDLPSEKSDGEASEEELDEADKVLAALDFADWAVIRASRAQIVLLEIGEDNGGEAVRAYVNALIRDHLAAYERGVEVMAGYRSCDKDGVPRAA